MEIIKSLNAMLTLAIMLSVGMFAYKQKWIDKKSSAILSKITVMIAIPSNIFYSLVSGYDRQMLLQVISSINVPLLAILLVSILSLAIAFVMKVQKTRIGLFVLLSSFSNTIFMGIPVVLSILGRDGLAYLPIYYIGNTILFWTLGVFLVKNDAKLIAKGQDKSAYKKPSGIIEIFISVCKYFVNPVIVLFFLAIVVVLLQIKMPVFIMDALGYLSSSATPLSMLYIGGYLYAIFAEKSVKHFYIKDMALIIFIKFIVLPFVVYLLLRHIDMPILLKRTFLLISIMPSMNQSVMLSSNYNADSEYAVVGNIATLLFTPIALIAYALLMSRGYI